MLMKAKTALIVIVAVWAFSSALQNIIDWQGTIKGVIATTSMTTIEGGETSWKATSHPVAAWTGALFILLSKVFAGILCSNGALKMYKADNTDIDTFHKAKNIALTGCLIAIIMLFGGFIVVAEGWYELWRSDILRTPVIESAFRYGCMISLIALIVASPEHKS